MRDHATYLLSSQTTQTANGELEISARSLPAEGTYSTPIIAIVYLALRRFRDELHSIDCGWHAPPSFSLRFEQPQGHAKHSDMQQHTS